MLGPLNCGASVILFLPVICIVNLKLFVKVQSPCGEKTLTKKLVTFLVQRIAYGPSQTRWDGRGLKDGIIKSEAVSSFTGT